jgi:cytochrome bd-type quinol oxidase subunit 2
MAFHYKPGEDNDVLKKLVLSATILVALAAGVVTILYVGLGIDTKTLGPLIQKIKLDATNVTFIFVFVVSSIALWGLFRQPAAVEGVNRRQTYFILLLILASVTLAGAIFFERLAKPTHDVVKTEVCSRCGGGGRAKLRPEYPCGACAGTGYITP